MSGAARRWTWPLAASLLAVGLLCLVLASAAGATQTVFWGSFNAGKISHAPIGAVTASTFQFVSSGLLFSARFTLISSMKARTSMNDTLPLMHSKCSSSVRTGLLTGV